MSVFNLSKSLEIFVALRLYTCSSLVLGKMNANLWIDTLQLVLMYPFIARLCLVEKCVYFNMRQRICILRFWLVFFPSYFY